MVMRPPWLSGVMTVLGGISVFDMFGSEQVRWSEVGGDQRGGCRYTYAIDIRTTFDKGQEHCRCDHDSSVIVHTNAFSRPWRGPDQHGGQPDSNS